MATTAMKLNEKEKKDLEKFTKFLALKSAQIIVQSRLGEKISTKSQPYNNGNDWFNLKVQDLPEVAAEARQAISNNEVGSTRLPICVEISLRTAEGDTMVLETWCLTSLPEQCDSTFRVTHNVYNRMGILLKSLVCVTRVTPAYKLSRRQNPDSYVICYRIYMGEPQFHNLGDGYKQVRVGQVCTPIGTLHLSVTYRTKLTISPTEANKENSIMLKSDHFNTENETKNQHNETNCLEFLNRPLKRGAFVTQDTINYPQVVNKPFEKLFMKSTTTKAKDTSSTISTSISLPKFEPKPNSMILSRRRESLIKEVRPLSMPFADPNRTFYTNITHLYWYFKDAPQLQSLEKAPSLEEQDILGQLEEFQKKASEYNAFVKELIKSDDESGTEEEQQQLEKRKLSLRQKKRRKIQFENSSTERLTKSDENKQRKKKDRIHSESDASRLGKDEIDSALLKKDRTLSEGDKNIVPLLNKNRYRMNSEGSNSSLDESVIHIKLNKQNNSDGNLTGYYDNKQQFIIIDNNNSTKKKQPVIVDKNQQPLLIDDKQQSIIESELLSASQNIDDINDNNLCKDHFDQQIAHKNESQKTDSKSIENKEGVEKTTVGNDLVQIRELIDDKDIFYEAKDNLNDEVTNKLIEDQSQLSEEKKLIEDEKLNFEIAEVKYKVVSVEKDNLEDLDKKKLIEVQNNNETIEDEKIKNKINEVEKLGEKIINNEEFNKIIEKNDQISEVNYKSNEDEKNETNNINCEIDVKVNEINNELINLKRTENETVNELENVKVTENGISEEQDNVKVIKNDNQIELDNEINKELDNVKVNEISKELENVKLTENKANKELDNSKVTENKINKELDILTEKEIKKELDDVKINENELDDVKITENEIKKELDDVKITENEIKKELDDVKITENEIKKELNDVKITENEIKKELDDVKISENEINKELDDVKITENEINKELNDVKITENEINKELVNVKTNEISKEPDTDDVSKRENS